MTRSALILKPPTTPELLRNMQKIILNIFQTAGASGIDKLALKICNLSAYLLKLSKFTSQFQYYV